MIPNFFNAILAGKPAPTIGRTAVKGFVVSTADTSDEGPETAIIDAKGTHPVERYADLVSATAGHQRWVEFCETGNGKQINQLGDSEGFVENETRTLEAYSETHPNYIDLSTRKPVT